MIKYLGTIVCFIVVACIVCPAMLAEELDVNASPDKVIDYLASIDVPKRMLSKEVQNYYDRLSQDPKIYAPIIRKKIKVPKLKDAPSTVPSHKGITPRNLRIIGLVQYLGASEGAPIAVNTYKRATQRIEEVTREMRQVKSTSKHQAAKQIKKQMRHLQAYVIQLEGIRWACVRQMASLKSTALVAYSLSTFDSGIIENEPHFEGDQEPLMRYYKSVKAVDALLSIIKESSQYKFPNSSQKSYLINTSIEYLQQMELSPQQKQQLGVVIQSKQVGPAVPASFETGAT